MDRNLYKFGMDWLNGVLPVTDVMSFFEMLEMFSSKLRFDRWKNIDRGLYNYKEHYILDGKHTIKIAYNKVSDEERFTALDENNSHNPYIFISISGDGIRYLHSLGGDVSALNKLMFYLYRNGFRCSRFDTYCDILDEYNQVVPLLQQTFSTVGTETIGELKPVISTKINRTNMSKIRRDFKYIPLKDDNGNEFYNCQLGNHGTDVGMFRCYNKLVELLDGRLSGVAAEIVSDYQVNGYWYRLEYEMHKENARQCFNMLMEKAESENSPLCFEDIFNACLTKMFSIKELRRLAVPRDLPVHPFWQQFLDFVSNCAIHLVQFAPVKYVRCSLRKLQDNSERISGYWHAINEYLATLSPDDYLDFRQRAKDKYENNAFYNELRDELSDLHISIKSLNNKRVNETWTQLPIDYPVPDFA